MKRTTTTAMIVLLAAGWLSVSAHAKTPETLLVQVGTVPETWQKAAKGCGDETLAGEIKSELKSLEKARADVANKRGEPGGPRPNQPSKEDMAAMQDMAQWMMHRQEEDSDFKMGVNKVQEAFKSESEGLEKKLAKIRADVKKKYDCREGEGMAKASADCAARRDAELKKRSLAAVDAYLKRAGATFEQYRALIKQHLDVVQQNVPSTCEESSFPAVVVQLTTVKSDMYEAVQKLNGELASICETVGKIVKPFAADKG